MGQWSLFTKGPTALKTCLLLYSWWYSRRFSIQRDFTPPPFCLFVVKKYSPSLLTWQPLLTVQYCVYCVCVFRLCVKNIVISQTISVRSEISCPAKLTLRRRLEDTEAITSSSCCNTACHSWSRLNILWHSSTLVGFYLLRKRLQDRQANDFSNSYEHNRVHSGKQSCVPTKLSRVKI